MSGLIRLARCLTYLIVILDQLRMRCALLSETADERGEMLLEAVCGVQVH